MYILRENIGMLIERRNSYSSSLHWLKQHSSVFCVVLNSTGCDGIREGVKGGAYAVITFVIVRQESCMRVKFLCVVPAQILIFKRKMVEY